MSKFKNVMKFAQKKKKIIIILCIIIVVFSIIFFVFLKPRQRGGQMENFSGNVQSAVAEISQIDSTVSATGSISMENAIDVEIPIGLTIDKVYVESGDTVKKGDKLVKIDNLSIVNALLEAEKELENVEEELEEDDLSDLEEEKLEAEKENLEDTIDTLEDLHDSPIVKASSDGTIGSVAVSEGSEVTKTTSSSNSSDSSNSSNSGSNSNANAISQMSYRMENKMKDSVSVGTIGRATTSDNAMLLLSADNATVEEVAQEEVEKIRITDFSEFSIEAPKKGETPQSEIQPTQMYCGSISWNAGSVFRADTEYTATIVLTAKDNYYFSASNLPVISGAVYDWRIEEDQTILRMTATFERTESEATTQSTQKPTTTQSTQAATTAQPAATTSGQNDNTTQQASTQGSSSSGSLSSGSDQTSSSIVGSTSQSSGGTSSSNSNLQGSASSGVSSTASGSTSSNLGSTSGTSSVNSQQSLGASSSGSSSAGTVSGTSSSGSSSTGTTSGSSSSNTASGSSNTSTNYYEAVIMTILSQDEASVAVSIDELDILDIEEGQTATITLDAIEDKEYEGEISKIASEATNSGGSAKYEVEVSMEIDENMRSGMSASVTIHTADAQNVVVIPVLALQEKENKTFVYTQMDENGNLSGEVEIETGVSDGTNVEITSGLDEGDTVYYTRESSSDSQEEMSPGNGNNPFGGGEMGGGSRPSEGGPGGGGR